MGGAGIRRFKRRPVPEPRVVLEKAKEEARKEKVEIRPESVKREAIDKLRDTLRKRIQTKVSKEIENAAKKEILKSLIVTGGAVIASAVIQLLAPVVTKMSGLPLARIVGLLETLKRVGIAVADGLANKSFAGMATSILSGLMAAIIPGMPLADEAIRGIASKTSRNAVDAIAPIMGVSGSTKLELGRIIEHAAEDSIKEVIEEEMEHEKNEN